MDGDTVTVKFSKPILSAANVNAVLVTAPIDPTHDQLQRIDLTVPTLAIGYTWYRAGAQRTHVNTACKRLLLGHAFDALGMRTVYLHTSHHNLRSQAAIERLGAHRDGVIRQHKRHKDGGLRDTVCYSILDTEWPAMRERLDAWLL